MLMTDVSHGSVEYKDGVTVVHLGVDEVDASEEPEMDITPWRERMRNQVENGRRQFYMRGKSPVQEVAPPHRCQTQVTLKKLNGMVMFSRSCIDQVDKKTKAVTFKGCGASRAFELLPKDKARAYWLRLRGAKT